MQDIIDHKKTRALFKKGSEGKTNRVILRLTITQQTKDLLEKIVPYGKGLYGSPFIALCVWFVCVILLSENDFEVYDISQKFKSVINERKRAKVMHNLKIASEIILS